MTQRMIRLVTLLAVSAFTLMLALPSTSRAATEPETTIHSITERVHPAEWVQAQFTATADSFDRFECRIGDAEWEACGTDSSSGLFQRELGYEHPTGTYAFEVRAVDTDGTVESTPARAEYTVADWIWFTSDPVAAVTNDARPQVSFEVDPTMVGAGAVCAVDRMSDDDFVPCSSPFRPAQTLSDGYHSISIRAVNQWGSTTGRMEQVSFKVDTSVPEAEFLPGQATRLPSFMSIAFTVSDVDDDSGSAPQAECRVDGGAWVTSEDMSETSQCWVDGGDDGELLLEGPLASDGEHLLEVRAVDQAGNRSAPASMTVTSSADQPLVYATNRIDPVANRSTVAFKTAAAFWNADIKCRLDGGAWQPCNTAFVADDLSDGDHTVDVGEASAIEQGWPETDGGMPPQLRAGVSYRFTVDTTDPTTTIVAGPSGRDNTPSAEFRFTSDDPGARFQCRLDDGEWFACTSPLTLDALADGAHHLAVRAVDQAGNVDGRPAGRTWTVGAAPSVPAPGTGTSPSVDPAPDSNAGGGAIGTSKPAISKVRVPVRVARAAVLRRQIARAVARSCPRKGPARRDCVARQTRRLSPKLTFTVDRDAQVTLELVKDGTVHASSTADVRAGRQSVRWNGRLGSTTIKPGRYTVRLTAVDAAGTSKPVSRTLIVR